MNLELLTYEKVYSIYYALFEIALIVGLVSLLGIIITTILLGRK